MSEFEELVARDGVLLAGRFGPDGRVAEHKADRWYIGNPVAAQMATWFCSAITTTLSSMAYAIDVASGASAGSGMASWLPVKGWAFTGGEYMIVVRGDRFIIAERAKVASLDELDRLVGNRQP